MRTEREILDEKARLVVAARAIHEAAEGRALTTEEQTNMDAAFRDIGVLETELTRNRNLAAFGDIAAPQQQAQRPEGGQRNAQQEAELRDFNTFLRTGRIPQGRALQVDPDTGGGYLAAPQVFVNNLIMAIDNQTFVRQWANVLPPIPTAQSIGLPYMASDIDDAEWVGELQTGSDDSGLQFGKRELHPHALAKRIKISNTLLRMVPTIDAFALQRMAYKFQITWEKAGLTGNGNNKPLGVFVATPNGIPTSRDVSEGNTATSPTFDGVLAAKYTLKAAYWARARWLWHRDSVKKLALLKDGEGRYLWAESTRAGEPDTLAGLPFYVSEYVPNTFTTGQYVGILGDWKAGYQVVDTLNFAVQRLAELYAETNQTGFIGRWESDGMPVLPEAFVRVKLG